MCLSLPLCPYCRETVPGQRSQTQGATLCMTPVEFMLIELCVRVSVHMWEHVCICVSGGQRPIEDGWPNLACCGRWGPGFDPNNPGSTNFPEDPGKGKSKINGWVNHFRSYTSPLFCVTPLYPVTSLLPPSLALPVSAFKKVLFISHLVSQRL